MAADGIGGDGQERPAEIGHQRGARGEIDVALLADGVGRRIVLGRVVGVEEQRVGGLIAFEVEETERLPLAHDVDPVLSGGHHLAVLRVGRIERAFGEHQCAPSQQPI